MMKRQVYLYRNAVFCLSIKKSEDYNIRDRYADKDKSMYQSISSSSLSVLRKHT